MGKWLTVEADTYRQALAAAERRGRHLARVEAAGRTLRASGAPDDDAFDRGRRLGRLEVERETTRRLQAAVARGQLDPTAVSAALLAKSATPADASRGAAPASRGIPGAARPVAVAASGPPKRPKAPPKRQASPPKRRPKAKPAKAATTALVTMAHWPGQNSGVTVEQFVRDGDDFSGHVPR
jgi:hypothetical protein